MRWHQVIGVLEVSQLEFGLVPVLVLLLKDLAIKNVTGGEISLLTWLLVMKQVSAEQNEVNFSIVGDLQALFEGLERVLTCHLIFLSVAHMGVCRYQDL